LCLNSFLFIQSVNLKIFWNLFVCIFIFRLTYWLKEIWINNCFKLMRNLKNSHKGPWKVTIIRNTTTCSWGDSTTRTTKFSSWRNSTGWCSQHWTSKVDYNVLTSSLDTSKAWGKKGTINTLDQMFLIPGNRPNNEGRTHNQVDKTPHLFDMLMK
jgi:hypothetical protein